MQPTKQPGYLIHHLGFVMDRQSDQVLQERLGIGFSQFKILMALQWHEDVRQRHIADYLGQTEASISRQIKLMTEKGLLISKISPRNRREHIASLTKKGLKLAEEAMRVLNQYHSPVFERLSDKQQSQLSEMLIDMHRETCRSDKPSRCQQSYLD
jgi:DNA-binding MarR family transcriptional regulator